jgi:hypothetical protein
MGLRDRIITVLNKNEIVFINAKQMRMKFLMVVGKIIPDKTYIKMQYRIRLGKKLDLETPVLFNEKIQFAKLYYRDERLKKLVDKYEVRFYVREKIGEKYLTKIYGVYDKVDEIPFEQLPDKFAMKLTNGSSYNYICSKKNKDTKQEIEYRFKKWLTVDFYMLGREWAYKDVKNRIICEEYLNAEEDDLKDYKIFCFDGVPKLIQVDYSRFVNHKRNLYTPEWEFIDEEVEYDNDPNADIKKPDNLEEMLICAHKLSEGFPQVRVDFYNIGSRLVFGEMTFYHGAGYLHFKNPEFEEKMGNYWKL